MFCLAAEITDDRVSQIGRFLRKTFQVRYASNILTLYLFLLFYRYRSI